MEKVIKLLEQELERQGILRKSNEVNEKINLHKQGLNPFLNSHLYENEIRKAIKILKKEGQ